MLTYMEVHLYFTLPVLALLAFLYKPFFTTKDRFKYIFLCTVAFATASPWDNYIVYHKAWSYCPECVTAVIGYVPLEEYMFFIIMTLITVTFTSLTMRWTLPSFFIRPETPVFQSVCVRYIPIVGFLTIAAKAWASSIPDSHPFYGACILWYVCPVLALLWIGSGEYMLRRWKAVLFSIAVPTIFLCWVDQYAIARGTWDISRRTSTGIMVLPSLPLEEFLFFLLIDTVLVFASCATDRAHAIVHIYITPMNHNKVSTWYMDFFYLCWAFLQTDQALSGETLSDLDATWRILREASASFYTASSVFSFEARQDLGVLYGFCRATDDLADNNDVSVPDRKKQLELVRGFVRQMFDSKHGHPDIDWTQYSGSIPDSFIAAFRSFTRLRDVLEIKAVEELLDGYTFDLEQREVKNEDDLVYYSACVASSVGEMCTRVLMASEPGGNRTMLKWTVERARDMGLALQLTNIARDIVTDSKQLGRSYVPRDWLTSQESALLKAGKARELGDERLRQIALKMVYTADDLNLMASRAIDYLPPSSRCGVRAACNVYTAIGVSLHKANGYPDRAHLTKLERMKVTFRCVYGFRKGHQGVQGDRGKSQAFTVI
ncbi:Phytoene Synthase/Lycopene cyclase [Phycomyces blakesleeanus]|uniref:Bifunctional lycopene cyclase/phytoene synthase n=3 Tax=Phycomyces blakesleeanus TaxID=4837 RepID=LCPS_PHYB8|nr:Phytoene Synthase/Lycopene cyclase [Phycomyces blakesleeanus NRRL 1555(-)]Q9P854.1 RecName: Full=Bifunctional lycopene cyclase/phytoene synthase; Includes: RecName: Full=Lycopene beta-cyclase; AltName: Full=Lycopene cyclase; Includes: RecName: Full=Phytoene synthase [Phycomyces blakesleeanus NRRL 1555(-)]OAD76523.1 Phytoene Synthase/Lycopene cyclase [Phycomyces blakesleeanus NRRL 1555(-)]CAB93661.1 lycopene cyclase/phytoene synthase [Phycomyces blakesleeanus]|eukprot:XP_018294563.1 Phytoene Synthase/Lycopene cyclase [Phycomyces blakesleeanus NRRL 1555(-)]